MNSKLRKTIIAGNWKMNMTASQIGEFIDGLKAGDTKGGDCETVICAPFPLIPELINRAAGCVRAGAQNLSEHEKGAYTGEVNAAMLSDLGVEYVIVGHSERREYFAETDFLVNEKAKAVLGGGMTPIICVGETLEQRERGITMEHIACQVKAALYGLEREQALRCVIAYEPVWAIGTGKTATAEQAAEVCAHIRALIGKAYGAEAAQGISVLYGGSMNAGNAHELLAMPDIDGGLIGGASLKPADFARIIAATGQAAPTKG